MIHLSNGHAFKYMVASGALAFDGRGWWWEKPLVWTGLIQPELFTVVIKTLTRQPRKGNLKMWKPWTCVRPMLSENSVVNMVGLTNPGIDWWLKKIGSTVDRNKQALVGSIYGTRLELAEMAKMFNDVDVVALEVNASCPNTGHLSVDTLSVVDDVLAVKRASRHPIIVKVSVAQDYCNIVASLEDVAEAVALNSVPFEIVFPDGSRRSPLWLLQQRLNAKGIKTGGGGVSGKLAQRHNWAAVRRLVTEVHAMPVIAPSAMCSRDVEAACDMGAKAISFGAIHVKTPGRPTAIVTKEAARKRA